jgi:MFS transporter, BCD family, chlorophyll transporter
MKPSMSLFAKVAAMNRKLSGRWKNISPALLPFADAASTDMPLSRLLRLSLFQVSVGMATALLIGTLNRVMIVELGVAAWLVSIMVALPLVFAPFRAFIGYRSDTYRSVLGWRRVPYLWLGTMLQFGGLAIMPFALILLSGNGNAPYWVGQAGAALAFLLVGAGLQTTQTAGLALATDLANDKTRPRVVALMYVMLLVGMLISGLGFSAFLSDFSNTRLVQVVQGSAVITVLLNLCASWKQEPRKLGGTAPAADTPNFLALWRVFTKDPKSKRFLLAVGLGSASFSMQDIILEPYGGEILKLGVSATTFLTAIMAAGALVAFAIAARALTRGANPNRLAAYGLLIGLPAFSLVIFAEPLNAPNMFRVGTFLIGLGGGLFSVATLTAAMTMDANIKIGNATSNFNGMALGAWGAVQASCAGIAVAIGGIVRDVVSALAVRGDLGEVLANPATGYSFVYHAELVFLILTLIVIGPLARFDRVSNVEVDVDAAQKVANRNKSKFGLSDLPA